MVGGGGGHLSLFLCPAATQRPVTATAAIRWEMRARLAYISEGRAWPSTVISANASTAMLSTALKVEALQDAAVKVTWRMVLVNYFYIIVMLNKPHSGLWLRLI